MKKFVMPLVLLVGACAAPPAPPPFERSTIRQADRDLVQTVFEQNLGQSDSAQTRDIQVFQFRTGKRLLCGQVNSIDGFEEFTGFRVFSIERNLGVADQQAFQMGRLASERCAEVGYRPIIVETSPETEVQESDVADVEATMRSVSF